MSLACEGEQEAQHETTIPSFSVTSGMDYTLPGYINGVPGNLLVDTGAAATLLAKTVWDKAKTSGAQLETPAKMKLIGVQGIPLQLHGRAQVSIKLGDEVFVTRVIVADCLTTDVILGRDFLREHQCTIEMGGKKDVLHFKVRGMAIALDSKSPEGCHVNVVLDSTLHKAKTSGAQLETPAKMKLIGVQGIPLQLHGWAQVSIKLGDEVFVTRVIAADCLDLGEDSNCCNPWDMDS